MASTNKPSNINGKMSMGGYNEQIALIDDYNSRGSSGGPNMKR
jgi:hypothetical protein